MPRHSIAKAARADVLISRILAHQNPPKLDAMTTKPRSDELNGVALNRPLAVQRMISPRHTRTSTKESLARCFLANNKAETNASAHKSPENTFVLSPGSTTT